MKRTSTLVAFLVLTVISQLSTGQNQGQRFKMEGSDYQVIAVNQSFTSSAEIFPFEKNVNKVFGLAVTAKIMLNDETSEVRIILTDKNSEEYLIYEGHQLLAETGKTFLIDRYCEETCVLDDAKVKSVKIEIINGTVELESLTFARAIGRGVNIEKVKKEKKQGQNEEKIDKINKSLKEKGLGWVAGPTSVAEMSFAKRKQLFGQSAFPPGFEFYAGGVISAGKPEAPLKSAIASMYVDEWDWRNRHGRNWITLVVSQGSCGSCWAFAAVGATEAITNLFFNQLLNPDLSEQDLLSCSGAGSCSGGYPGTALNYIATSGVVDEKTFPYNETYQSCTNKGSSPSELIKIGGKIDFGSTTYPKTEDNLKKMLIQAGPVSGGLTDWSHAMVLVGYKVVKEGDRYYYREYNIGSGWRTITAGDPLIGKTVWIFKNSWGLYFGDAGYVYVETPITNFNWTHGLKTPVTSSVKNHKVICEDRDGDGYYWWGLGPKPATCTGPDTPDGNDADATLGPLDQYGNCTVLTKLPIANFTANKTSIMAIAESIQFSDFSSENAVTRSWIFQGGIPATSSEKNPVITYSTPGNYSVTLVVTNSFGSNTKTVENFVSVSEFIPHYCMSKGNSVDEWIGSVQFGTQINTSGSSGTNGYQDFSNYIFSTNSGTKLDFTLTPKFSSFSKGEFWRIWIDYNGDKDFNDTGELVYSSVQRAGVVTGSFTIPSNLNISTKMRISMKNGSLPSQCEIFGFGEVEDYSIKIGSPGQQPPIAQAGPNQTVNEGVMVTLDGSLSNDPDGAPLTYKWTAPAGISLSSVTAQKPTFVAPEVSVNTGYTFSLVVSDGTANSQASQVTVTVTNVNKLPVAHAGPNQAVNEGVTVTLDGSLSNDPDGAPLTYNWTAPAGISLSSITAQKPTFIAPKVSINTSYTFSLVVNDGTANSQASQVSVTVQFTGLPPIADFTSDKKIISIGESVQFTDLSTQNPVSWEWQFQGGTSPVSNVKNPLVAYNTAGSYRVSLTVTNPNGANTKVVESYITVNPVVQVSVEADFEASATNIKVGEQVTFTDKSTNTPTRWLWSFPGGTPASSTEQKPAVTYLYPGEYDVTLEVSKEGGLPSKKTKTKYIVSVEPAPVEYCIPAAVNSSSDFIQSVTVGNVLSNTSAGNGYSFNNNLVSMNAGISFSVSLTPKSSSNRNFWRVWIDFNSNGEFNNSEELVLVANNKKGTVKSSVSIPQTASGTARMRIAMRTGQAAEACSDGFNGEIEDYTVSFNAMASMGLTKSAELTGLGYAPVKPDRGALGFRLYPNPVNGALYIYFTSAGPNDSYSVYSVNGKRMVEGPITSTTTAVDFTGYPPGVYILKVLKGENLFNEKIIKK